LALATVLRVRFSHTLESSPMGIANIDKATAWFEILQTGQRSQTAVMTLKPGGATQPAYPAGTKG